MRLSKLICLSVVVSALPTRDSTKTESTTTVAASTNSSSTVAPGASSTNPQPANSSQARINDSTVTSNNVSSTEANTSSTDKKEEETKPQSSSVADSASATADNKSQESTSAPVNSETTNSKSETASNDKSSSEQQNASSTNESTVSAVEGLKTNDVKPAAAGANSSEPSTVSYNTVHEDGPKKFELSKFETVNKPFVASEHIIGYGKPVVEHATGFAQVESRVETKITKKPMDVIKEIKQPVMVDRPITVEKIIRQPVVIERPVEVEKIVKQPVYIEKPVIKVIHEPYENIIEKTIIAEKPVPVEKEVIREKPVRVNVPVPVPVEKEVIREKRVPVNVPVPVPRYIPKPVYIERDIEKEVVRPVYYETKLEKRVGEPVESGVHVGKPHVVSKETFVTDLKKGDAKIVDGKEFQNFQNILPPGQNQLTSMNVNNIPAEVLEAYKKQGIDLSAIPQASTGASEVSSSTGYESTNARVLAIKSDVVLPPGYENEEALLNFQNQLSKQNLEFDKLPTDVQEYIKQTLSQICKGQQPDDCIKKLNDNIQFDPTVYGNLTAPVTATGVTVGPNTAPSGPVVGGLKIIPNYAPEGPVASTAVKGVTVGPNTAPSGPAAGRAARALKARTVEITMSHGDNKITETKVINDEGAIITGPTELNTGKADDLLNFINNNSEIDFNQYNVPKVDDFYTNYYDTNNNANFVNGIDYSQYLNGAPAAGKEVKLDGFNQSVNTVGPALGNVSNGVIPLTEEEWNAAKNQNQFISINADQLSSSKIIDSGNDLGLPNISVTLKEDDLSKNVLITQPVVDASSEDKAKAESNASDANNTKSETEQTKPATSENSTTASDSATSSGSEDNKSESTSAKSDNSTEASKNTTVSK